MYNATLSFKLKFGSQSTCYHHLQFKKMHMPACKCLMLWIHAHFLEFLGSVMEIEQCCPMERMA